MERRNFLTNAAFTAAGLFVTTSVPSCKTASIFGTSASSEHGNTIDLMKEVFRYRKIDAHAHVNLFHGGPEVNIDFANRLGIEKMVISRPVTTGAGTPEEFRSYNNLVLKAMKDYPDRFIGCMTVNPQFRKESLEEIKRCTGEGMIGLKLYTQVKINDPLMFPVIEQLTDLKMIVHMHSECQLGVAGYRMKYDKGIKPEGSLPEDFADAARRYPETMFQFAHIGGGGDWEYECKILRDHPNIYVDISGSNNEENMINFALQHVGEDRLFFGTDSSYYQTIGNMLASDLTEKQRRKIFFDNYNNMLRRGGYHVD